ncbi:MAG: DUF5676 family membrane protein [Candidatus Levybacteria bacterium]|nr:DUF5676 family membrane protein [Candidatus Levybacteria bacterium]
MKEVPFANALALVSGLVSLICAAGVWLARDAFVGLFGEIFHGIDLAALPIKEVTMGGVITGLIVVVISGWVLGYIFASLYNKLAK